jgi:phosphotransferase system  glucose/maltose/N-acetylglucosamine-specific IIC component
VLLVANMWKWNVGQFFLLCGILLLLLYFATSQVDSPIVYYFCFGTILLLFGVFMMWIGRNPSVACRFRSLRRMSEKKKKPKNGSEKKPE